MSPSPEPALLLWLSVVTWPISAKGGPWEKVTKTVISCQQRVRQGCLEVMQMRGTFPTACLIHSRPEQARPGKGGAAQYSKGCPESQRTFRTVAHPPETKTAGGASLPCPSAHRANYFLAYYSLNILLLFLLLLLFFFKWFNRNYKLQCEQCFISCSEMICIYFFFS